MKDHGTVSAWHTVQGHQRAGACESLVETPSWGEGKRHCVKGLTTGAHSGGHEGPQGDLARDRCGQTGAGQWISSGIVLPPSQGNVAVSADI